MSSMKTRIYSWFTGEDIVAKCYANDCFSEKKSKLFDDKTVGIIVLCESFFPLGSTTSTTYQRLHIISDRMKFGSTIKILTVAILLRPAK